MGEANRSSPPKAAHALLGAEHGAPAALQKVSRSLQEGAKLGSPPAFLLIGSSNNNLQQINSTNSSFSLQVRDTMPWDRQGGETSLGMKDIAQRTT